MSCDCGCCGTPAGARAGEIRAGLSALPYRGGTFATFRQEIVQALAHAGGLERLTARGPGDYTITTIELWSAVADVLTFYQERMANEAFLRTAVSRDSVLRLVRLIGYELAPGLAATTWLAFTVERGETARVPARMRVKSKPLRDEPPQIFETLGALEADAVWNLLEPFRTLVHHPAAGDTGADFAGVSTGLAPGAVLAFVGTDKRTNPASLQWDVVRVRAVSPDPTTQRTRVTWWPALGSAGRPVPADARVFLLEQAASVFGHNAPDWHLIADAGKAQFLGLPGPADVTDDDRQEWPQFEIYAPSQPNAPRTKSSPGTLTIQPTVESVVAAALAAAKAEKEAVFADAAAAATRAAVALGKVTAAAEDARAELTALILAEGGKQVGVAMAGMGTFQAAIAAIKAEADALVGRFDPFSFWFHAAMGSPGGPVAAVAFFDSELPGIKSDAETLDRDVNNLPTDLSGTTLKVLEDLMKIFENVAREGGLYPANPYPLATKLAAVATLTVAAAVAADEAARMVFYPAGALAAERVLQIVLDTVTAHPDFLEPILRVLSPPERVALAAVIATELVPVTLDPAAAAAITQAQTLRPSQNVLDHTLPGRQLSTAASSFVTEAIPSAGGISTNISIHTSGVTQLFNAAIGDPVPWRPTFLPLYDAATYGGAAHPGARRVADAVYGALVLAVAFRHVPAPLRYDRRLLDYTSIDLDTVYPRIVRDGWLLLASPAREELYQISGVGQTSRTDFALTGPVTRVQLAGNGLAPNAAGHSVFNLRETAVFAASREVALAFDTLQTPFSGGSLAVKGTLAPTPPGRSLLITGTDVATGKAAADATRLTDLTVVAAGPGGLPYTVLAFDPPVERSYALDGLAVYGNVAFATHGETVRREVLGDGDAASGFQRFALKKKPVTFTPAPKAGIIESSLEVMVGGVRWQERPTLYGAAPTDPVFTTRIADDRTLTVQFGDGVTGARLPSGRENVVVRYRQGLGLEGDLAAGRLATLLDRPPGLRGVVNPVPADGAADPESLAQAREIAPGTVRTFGRAVSLRDFEDTTLTAGIVARASATWVWTGERRAIHLTVGGPEGRTLSDNTIELLKEMLAVERDRNQKLIVGNYVPVPVLVAATITVDDRHVTAAVQAAARAALVEMLSFSARGFSQPVHLSEVFAVLQGIEGVVFVDVDTLDLKSQNAAFRAAHGVNDALGQPQPHLLMLPARPDLALASNVLPAELAMIESPGDVTVTAVGGLSS